MPNSVNPQSNSLHSQSHTQLTTLSCTTHNMLTTYPCLTTALASCQAGSSRVAVVVIGRRVDLPRYPFSRAFLPPHLTITLYLLYSLPYIWPPDSTLAILLWLRLRYNINFSDSVDIDSRSRLLRFESRRFFVCSP